MEIEDAVLGFYGCVDLTGQKPFRCLMGKIIEAGEYSIYKCLFLCGFIFRTFFSEQSGVCVGWQKFTFYIHFCVEMVKNG